MYENLTGLPATTWLVSQFVRLSQVAEQIDYRTMAQDKAISIS